MNLFGNLQGYGQQAADINLQGNELGNRTLLTNAQLVSQALQGTLDRIARMKMLKDQIKAQTRLARQESGDKMFAEGQANLRQQQGLNLQQEEMQQRSSLAQQELQNQLQLEGIRQGYIDPTELLSKAHAADVTRGVPMGGLISDAMTANQTTEGGSPGDFQNNVNAVLLRARSGDITLKQASDILANLPGGTPTLKRKAVKDLVNLPEGRTSLLTPEQANAAASGNIPEGLPGAALNEAQDLAVRGKQLEAVKEPESVRQARGLIATQSKEHEVEPLAYLDAVEKLPSEERAGLAGTIKSKKIQLQNLAMANLKEVVSGKSAGNKALSFNDKLNSLDLVGTYLDKAFDTPNKARTQYFIPGAIELLKNEVGNFRLDSPEATARWDKLDEINKIYGKYHGMYDQNDKFHNAYFIPEINFDRNVVTGYHTTLDKEEYDDVMNYINQYYTNQEKEPQMPALPG